MFLKNLTMGKGIVRARCGRRRPIRRILQLSRQKMVVMFIMVRSSTSEDNEIDLGSTLEVKQAGLPEEWM